jgi:hypothetical protein
MRIPLVISVFVAFLSTCLTGCVSSISHDTRYPTDYVVGGIYKLKRPVFAEKDWWTVFGYRGVILHDPNSQAAGMPQSVEDYERAKDQWKNIAAVLQSGTRIEVLKVQLDNNPENGKMVWVRGRLLDTDIGHGTAQLTFISRRISPPYGSLLGGLPMVDTNILELVTRP